MTNYYKNFLYELRKMEFEAPFIQITKEHPAPNLKHYVKMILDVYFDATAYNAYYGELVKNISSFVNFYTAFVDDVSKQAEEYSQYISHDEVTKLIENTIKLHDFSQEEFIKEFQPIESETEQEKLDMIISNNRVFKEQLFNISLTFACYTKKPDKIEEFVKDNCQKSIENTSHFCDFSHVYIAKFLADRLDHIRISIEDILHRVHRNQYEIQQEYDNLLIALYNEMYDLNKDSLLIMRRRTRQSKDIAEVRRIIDGVKEKIEKASNYEMVKRLHVENKYWSSKLNEFNEIAANITKIKNAIKELNAEEKEYSKYKVIELSGPKIAEWERIGELYKKKRIELEDKYTHASRTLITFFCCRGSDHILQTDSIGTYYVDSYGHQNYVTNYGANIYHVDCYGNYIQKSEKDKHYYDIHGRYILQEDEKIYQLAPCTSCYKLGEDQLLYKITEDCGHSSIPNKNCRIQIKKMTDTVLLPEMQEISIERSLDTKTIEYLWNAFGWILPEVLYEVGTAQPKNPIHLFGHLLLNKRYNMGESEVKAKKTEAQKYRQDSLTRNEELFQEARRKWLMAQPKHSKPEDLDTMTQYLEYEHQQNEQQFITDVVRCCYDE